MVDLTKAVRKVNMLRTEAAKVIFELGVSDYGAGVDRSDAVHADLGSKMRRTYLDGLVYGRDKERNNAAA